jgi:hypothetical protein
MAKVKPTIYKRGKQCLICEKDSWVAVPQTMDRMFIILADGAEVLLDKKNFMIGIGKADCEICMRCFELLLGLESYYSYPFLDILENNFDEAKQIIQHMSKNENRFQSYLNLKKGGYFPKEKIRNILKDNDKI